MNINERIGLIISTLYKGNKSAFANAIGVTPSVVENVVGKRQGKPSFDVVGKICAIAQLNTEWVMTGEGEMLNTPHHESLPAVSLLPSIPVIPVSARGGTLNDFVVSIRESDCERITSPIKGAQYAITVSGDSMAPDYPSGCTVLIKKVDESLFLEWGKVYVLDTPNGIVIKRLMPGDADGVVSCISVNEKYPPFEVNLASTFGIYKVLMRMIME